MSMMLDFDNHKCSQCYECVELCPGGALNLPFVDGYIAWDKSKCTNCETCMDICMEGAIKTRWE